MQHCVRQATRQLFTFLHQILESPITQTGLIIVIAQQFGKGVEFVVLQEFALLLVYFTKLQVYLVIIIILFVHTRLSFELYIC